MSLSHQERADLVRWIEYHLKGFENEQNPHILATYIQSLIFRQASKQSMIAILRDFMNDKAELFVDLITKHLESRDFSIPTEQVFIAPEPSSKPAEPVRPKIKIEEVRVSHVPLIQPKAEIKTEIKKEIKSEPKSSEILSKTKESKKSHDSKSKSESSKSHSKSKSHHSSKSSKERSRSHKSKKEDKDKKPKEKVKDSKSPKTSHKKKIEYSDDSDYSYYSDYYSYDYSSYSDYERPLKRRDYKRDFQSTERPRKDTRYIAPPRSFKREIQSERRPMKEVKPIKSHNESIRPQKKEQETKELSSYQKKTHSQPVEKPVPLSVQNDNRYIIVVCGLPNEYNSIGHILKEFNRFGLILAIQTVQTAKYALIQYAELEAAYRAVNSPHIFFKNSTVKIDYAFDPDPILLEALNEKRQISLKKKEMIIQQKQESEANLVYEAPPEINDSNNQENSLLELEEEIEENQQILLSTLSAKIAQYEQMPKSEKKDKLKKAIGELGALLDYL